MGQKKRERERVAGRQENSSGESSGVGDRDRIPEDSRVAENTNEDRQGVGGRVELPMGTDTPGV